MNDFTREELETLLYCVGETSSYEQTNEDILIDKIQSMIDNYCDHDQGFTEDSVLIKLCNKCDDIYFIHTEVPNE